MQASIWCAVRLGGEPVEWLLLHHKSNHSGTAVEFDGLWMFMVSIVDDVNGDCNKHKWEGTTQLLKRSSIGNLRCLQLTN